MAFMNNYTPEERKTFDIPDGDYKVRIMKAENAFSKTGLQMHCITLQVEGSAENYIHFICEGEFYNRKMTEFFDAFGIQRGNFNFSSWIGKITAARFEHRQKQFTGTDGLTHTANNCTLLFFHKTHKTLNSVQKPQTAAIPPQVQNLANAVGGAVQQEFPEDIPF